MKILFIGDIVGRPGRKVLYQELNNIRKEFEVDFCIANGENSAGGNGITYYVANELYDIGIDAITLGNHTWAKKEVINFIDDDIRIVRPANYSEGLPGIGSTLLNSNNYKIGIINLIGRVYMDNFNCPFRCADIEINKLKEKTNIIIIDFHAEATSEKNAMGWYVNGKVSCMVGTHTHVQTSDERILSEGTGYITDVGMTGPKDGVLGIDKSIILKKFLTLMPVKYEVAKGKVQLNAIIIEIDDITGKSKSIQRLNRTYNIKQNY